MAKDLIDRMMRGKSFLNEWRDSMAKKGKEMESWTRQHEGMDGDMLSHVGGLRVIVSFGEEADGKVWLHLSASHKTRVPSHKEMVDLKNLFIGEEKYAYTVLPPKQFYVNLHPNCLHLWSRCDGPALPEFSGFLGSVRSI
jgi:hypothetical protein